MTSHTHHDTRTGDGEDAGELGRGELRLCAVQGHEGERHGGARRHPDDARRPHRQDDDDEELAVHCTLRETSERLGRETGKNWVGCCFCGCFENNGYILSMVQIVHFDCENAFGIT